MPKLAVNVGVSPRPVDLGERSRMRSIASTCLVVRPRREHERELLAAVATRHVVGAQLVAQRLGEDAERAVAGLVAVRVVQRP